MYKRIRIAFFTLIVIFGILVSDIGIIMLKTGLSPSSQSNSSKSVVVSTSRGMIYDRNMKKLVNSDVINTTACLPTQITLNTLKNSLSEENMNILYENSKAGKISIFETTEAFDTAHVKSVVTSNRYSENQSCIHLIGHLDETGKGAMGLEKAYDSYLSKINGELKAVWSTDAVGHILLGDGIHFESNGYLSPAGIQLTIDLDIQKIAENALEKHNITKGAVVVLDSYTNEILAMASVPEFNPDDISGDIDNSDSPFINRGITPYSVGSVFKPIISACALENGVNINYTCNGIITINSTTFRCSNSNAHGNINMTEATEESCNCYFIQLGQTLSAEKLINLCNDFGFGKDLNLADNFNIKSGNLPTAEQISSPEAMANLSFGQGDLLASPLQLAVAYSCFANGGYYRPPTLMKGIIDENGNTVQMVRLPDSYRILNKSTVTEIDKMLFSVVTNGNGKNAYTQLTENHGKTATAQTGWYEDGREINHTWFCGYFESEKTTYTVVVFKDDGKSGSTDCAPAFKTISEEIHKINSSK